MKCFEFTRSSNSSKHIQSHLFIVCGNEWQCQFQTPAIWMNKMPQMVRRMYPNMKLTDLSKQSAPTPCHRINVKMHNLYPNIISRPTYNTLLAKPLLYNFNVNHHAPYYTYVAQQIKRKIVGWPTLYCNAETAPTVQRTRRLTGDWNLCGFTLHHQNWV